MSTKSTVVKANHLVLWVHHVFATFYYHFLVDYSKTNHDTIDLIRKFNVCYLTTWNFILQIVFLTISIYVDHLPESHKKYEKWSKIKGYLFHSIIVPSTVAVSFGFWSIFHYNRELMYPAVCDEVFPKWLNHSTHTVILVVLLNEYLLGKNVTPSFKSALIGLTCLTLAYQVTYLGLFFSIGKWLYNIYYFLTWTERLMLKLGLYVFGVLVLKGNLSFHTYKNAVATNAKAMKVM